MDTSEKLMGILVCAMDIVKWVMQMALAGRISRDRKFDIIHAAKRILELTEDL